MPKVGIDFGTTNSLLVAYNKSKNEFTYFNFAGARAVPTSSTVWYYDDKVVVGTEARNRIRELDGVEGNHFEKSIKAKLGTEEMINIFGDIVPPTKVATDIINNLKTQANKLASSASVDLNRAVFTIPVNFSGKARRALRKSANDAGIEVTTFVHEPFAAVVGYFFTKYDYLGEKEVKGKLNELEGQHLLIFDWGGGTLDITVVRVRNGKMEELGTAEMTGEAGDKIDELIATLVWSRFVDSCKGKYSFEYLEKLRKQKWGRMLAYAEKCKIELSTEDESEFIYDAITEDDDIYEIIDRNDLDNLMLDMLDAACNRIDNALNEARVKDLMISRVLLTGGTCYIPSVYKRIQEKFGHRVETVKEADLLIAQGAAVISEMGWLPYLTKDILIELSDDSFWPIFDEGLPLGAGKTASNSEVFSCVDQRSKRAKVIVCEGRGQVKHKNLTILNVPTLGDHHFNDDIIVSADIDKDIVMTIRAHSKMVHGYRQPEEEYSIQKKSEVHQLCFGLDFGG